MNSIRQRRTTGPDQTGSGTVWLLTILLLLFALATGYVWYKYSTQSTLLAQREGELASLEQSFETLQRDLDDAIQRTDEAEKRITELERSMKDARQDQAELANLESEIDRLRNEAAAMEGQLAKCRKQAEEAAAARDKLEARLESAPPSEEEGNGREEELQAEIAKLRDRLASCHGKLAELQAGLSAEEQNAERSTEDQLAAQAEAQRQDCSALAEELQTLRKQGTPVDEAHIDDLESGLLLCRSRADELEQEYLAEKQMAEAYEDMIEDLRQEIRDREVRIERIQDRLEIDILGQILFNTGSTHITRQGREVLDKLMPSLQKIENRRIYIMGHTDDVGIMPSFQTRFPTNWELSAARAATVVRHLIDNAGIPPENMAAMGMSSYHPKADNDTAEGRARNRRVEIMVGAPLLDE